jgi:hypothetical protein
MGNFHHHLEDRQRKIMASEKPKITVVLKDGQFQPVTSYDAQRLSEFPNNQIFDLAEVSQRSPEHHKLYWSILGAVVRSTGKWATSDHLHKELKMICGYHQRIISEITGAIFYVPDSIAMSKMNQQDFNVYFETAMMKLAEAIGQDPMELLK